MKLRDFLIGFAIGFIAFFVLKGLVYIFLRGVAP